MAMTDGTKHRSYKLISEESLEDGTQTEDEASTSSASCRRLSGTNVVVGLSLSFLALVMIIQAVLLSADRSAEGTLGVSYCREVHQAIFNGMDADLDGQVDLGELRDVCLRTGTSEQVARVSFVAMDENRDGYIKFKEFDTNYHVAEELLLASLLQSWNGVIGLSVTGNVANGASHAAPKGLVPFYLPPFRPNASEGLAGGGSGLEAFPVTSNVLTYPRTKGASQLQASPEMALLVDIVYAADGSTVLSLKPLKVAAFNDAELRQESKLENWDERKNWGFGSKGISVDTLSVDSLAPGSIIDHLVVTSFAKRGKEIHQYSLDHKPTDYALLHEDLLAWVVRTMNSQQELGHQGSISQLLEKSRYPPQAWLALGSGSYSSWAEMNDLQPGDELLVVVYDDRVHQSASFNNIVEALFEHPDLPHALTLHQVVV